MAELLMFVTIAWGVLSFGAVYPWAYWPMLGAAAATGLWCLLRARRRSLGRAIALGISWTLVGVAIGCQLIPLPSSVLAVLSPAADRLLANYDLAYATTRSPHALSIDPSRTAIALACFAALAIFCAGCARRLTTHRAAGLARAITVLGVIVAVIGVVQKASGTMLIYGFWRPIHHPYQIFGPFVNKNHFAGWMIMTLSLTLGSLASAIASARAIARGWRDRLLWLSSPDGSYVLLAAVSLPIMIAALLMTLSRSGITSWCLALAIGSMSLAWRSRRSARPAAITAVYAAVVVLLVVSWSRLDLVAQRFEVGSDVSLASRLKTWSDAVRIARDFPLFGTGLNTFDTAMVFYQSQPGGHWDAAHNDYVQLLADGGLLLCLPILVGVIALVREIARRLREERDDPEAYWLRAGAVLGLVAIGFQECLDFSLQLPGNAAMCAFLVAMAVRPTRGYNLGAVMS